MKSSKNIEPTSAELEILNVLWKSQPLTVRDVHNSLKEKKQVGYTTILKIMQNMFAKGLLKRKLQGKSHLYEATYNKEATRQNLLDKFLESTFSGSATSLVLQLLGNNRTPKKELEDIKKAIEELEKNSRK